MAGLFAKQLQKELRMGIVRYQPEQVFQPATQ
jgi:hypothetical protein